MNFFDKLSHAWNAFKGRDPTENFNFGTYNQYVSSVKPDRVRLFRGGNDRTIITAVYNRIAMDVASSQICHVRIDENNKFKEIINDGLNQCLTVEANKDQTSRNFLLDLVVSLFDEGCIAVVPTDTSINPNKSSSFEIFSMRVGRITQWTPDHVRVKLYNDNTGCKEEIYFKKSAVAIIENPFYTIMNEPSSTLKRLSRKLALLDLVDEQSSSGKLDLLIQLPYAIKSTTRKTQAEERRKDVEEQLKDSRYGVAYIDGTEKVTQLNRPVENNLMKQIEYLIKTLYSQLGITSTILDGTANSETMSNYYSRIIEPIISAITDEVKRKFLTKTARSQGQSIMYFRDPFKLIPPEKVADMADKFTRNEIMSPNEFRQIIGLKPVADAQADQLRNRNINAGAQQEYAVSGSDQPYEEGIQNEAEQNQYPATVDVQTQQEEVENEESAMDIILGMTLSEIFDNKGDNNEQNL